MPARRLDPRAQSVTAHGARPNPDSSIYPSTRSDLYVSLQGGGGASFYTDIHRAWELTVSCAWRMEALGSLGRKPLDL